MAHYFQQLQTDVSISGELDLDLSFSAVVNKDVFLAFEHTDFLITRFDEEISL